MLYVVKARPRLAELPRFWNLLNDGTIGKQEPDGMEIIASMKRAVIHGETAEWYETCYCNPPLRHERSTIYDQFFAEMAVEPASRPQRLEGARFWDYLRNRSNVSIDRDITASTTSHLRYVPIRVL